MRAFHLLILLFATAASLPAMAADAPKATATPNTPSQSMGERSAAQKVQDCMSDIERGQKAGQGMTKPQRMLAEAQCRAAADTRK